jgi:hypothetical protein
MHLEPALDLKERHHGPDDRLVASTLLTLAQVTLGERDVATARRLVERGLVIRRRALGGRHPAVAEALAALAAVEQASAEVARALALSSARSRCPRRPWARGTRAWPRRASCASACARWGRRR